MLRIYYLKLSDYYQCPNREFRCWVPIESWEQMQHISSKKTARTKILGEAMCRKLIYDLWNISPLKYKIAVGKHGKPYFVGLKPYIFYNISHSGDYIICALSDCEVGVDIELRGNEHMQLAYRYFNTHEILRLESFSPERRRIMFYNYWAAKESFLKYLGVGLSGSLSSFVVHFSEDKQSWIEKEHSRLPIFLKECSIDAQYSSYVCYETDADFNLESFRF